MRKVRIRIDGTMWYPDPAKMIHYKSRQESSVQDQLWWWWCGCGYNAGYTAARSSSSDSSSDSSSGMAVAQVLTDLENLPEDVRDKLAELDLELSEGKQQW